MQRSRVLSAVLIAAAGIAAAGCDGGSQEAILPLPEGPVPLPDPASRQRFLPAGGEKPEKPQSP